MATRKTTKTTEEPGELSATADTESRDVVTDAEGNRLVPVEGGDQRYVLLAPGGELPYDERRQGALADPRISQQFPPHLGPLRRSPAGLGPCGARSEAPVPEDQLATQPTKE